MGARRPAPPPPGRRSRSSPALDLYAPRLVVGLAERDLDPEDAVVVGRRRLLGLHIRAQLDHALERAVRDLDLLIEPVLGLLGAPLARDHQLAAADLERDVVGIDTGD